MKRRPTVTYRSRNERAENLGSKCPNNSTVVTVDLTHLDEAELELDERDPSVSRYSLVE